MKTQSEPTAAEKSHAKASLGYFLLGAGSVFTTFTVLAKLCFFNPSVQIMGGRWFGGGSITDMRTDTRTHNRATSSTDNRATSNIGSRATTNNNSSVVGQLSPGGLQSILGILSHMPPDLAAVQFYFVGVSASGVFNDQLLLPQVSSSTSLS